MWQIIFYVVKNNIEKEIRVSRQRTMKELLFLIAGCRKASLRKYHLN